MPDPTNPRMLLSEPCKSCDARCCRGLAVVLTIPEALRLQKALGKPPEEFMEFSSSVNYRRTPHYPLLAKTEAGITEYFIILKKQPGDNACIFLNKLNMCGIHRDRPHVCRLYPFDFDAKKMKKTALCPKKYPKEEEMEATARALLSDLHEHGVMARGWSAGRAGEVPDMRKFLEYFGNAQNGLA